MITVIVFEASTGFVLVETVEPVPRTVVVTYTGDRVVEVRN